MSNPSRPDRSSHSAAAASPPPRGSSRRTPRLPRMPRAALMGITLALLVAVAVPIAAAARSSASAPAASGYPVKVYFSHHPQSDSTPTYVVAVRRVSPTLGVATYAIRQLIAGPTSAERAAGAYTELSGALSGPSNCDGRDFVITLNHRGSTPETGTATLRFCRLVLLPGDLSGARVSAEITATILQFANNHRVVILTRDGNCFNDLSGQNRCLGFPVKVYFSRHPASDSDPSAVFAVWRISPTLGVATYAVNQLIAGPNAAEQAADDYTELGGALSGASNCGGREFVIRLNTKGTQPAPGVITLQFCRAVLLPGDLSGFRISAEITAILLQFPNNQRVVILTDTGQCFNDLSGQNRCLD